MPASDLPHINFELILGIGTSLVAIVAWLIRMEAATKNNRDKVSELHRDIEKVDLRIEKLEARHDTIKNELTSMLISIQSSLSKVEGRLERNRYPENSRRHDDDR